MSQKVLKIGNSLGVTLPRDFVVKHKIKRGAKIAVKQSTDAVIFSAKVPKDTEYEEILDSELVQLVCEVDKKYGNALDELSKLR